MDNYFKPKLEKELYLYGVIISIGKGVVILQGFTNAFIGEVFCVNLISIGGISIGLVVNICRDKTMNLLVGGLLVNSSEGIVEGAKIQSLRRLACLLLGDYAIGSVIDPVGEVILNSDLIIAEYRWIIESPAVGIIDRQSVFEPLQTGILSIDSMIPIGRGQRELIIGDRGTGKTSIGLDTIVNQKHENVLTMYVAIAQKAASILETYMALMQRDSTFYTSIYVQQLALLQLDSIYLHMQESDSQNISCLSEKFHHL